MRLGCIWFIIMIALLWGGGQNTYEAWNSSKLLNRTYDQMVTENPGVGWFELGDASWKLSEAKIVVSEGTNVPTGEMYIPVRKNGADATGKAQIILHRTNQAEANEINRLMELEKQKKPLDEATLDKVFAPHSVKGMVEFGIKSDDDLLEHLKGVMGDELAENYLVLTDGAEPPGYGWSLAALAGGLVMMLGLLIGLVSKGEETSETS